MIFEVPVDHFPVQRTRPQRPPTIVLPQLSVLQNRDEISAATLLSPSVNRSQFTFSAVPRRLSSAESTSSCTVSRASSMPSLAHRSSVPTLPVIAIAKIISNPLRLLSNAFSTPHLA
ncbi:hypothetical protein Q1695_002221 [Nippostrongylus brasiliensis]|nr:hypothetical protein Q1695_002221 [Nippostrongylus brasiliensis]